jgi:hypothetical protein
MTFFFYHKLFKAASVSPPLPRRCVQMQVNQEQFAHRGVAGVIRAEGVLSLYRGAEWTAPRNFCGSFALFGTASCFKKVCCFLL